MSEWEDRVDAHAALASLAAIRERLDALPEQDDASSADALDRNPARDRGGRQPHRRPIATSR